MIKLLWSGLLIMLLSGCGWNGTPTRENDFTTLTSIEITAVSQTIAAQTSTKLTVIGNFSGVFTRDITDKVEWSSDSPTVAGFVNTTSPSRVTGHAPGTAILTATVGNVSNTFTLTVSSATVTAMVITPANPTVPQGLTQQFAVTGTFSDSTTQDITFDATWASTVPTVATVSDAVANKGLAATLAIGSTMISATFNSVSDSTQLTVDTPTLQSITVSTTTPSLLTLSNGSFQATGVYSNGATSDITSQVTWASSSPTIATINTSGTVTTLAQGTTSISATLDSITGTASLKVTGGTLTAISITPTTPTLAKGTTSHVTATGTFSSGSSRDITGAVAWSVADTSIATVTVSGPVAWLNTLAVTSTATTITAKSGTVTGTTSLTVTDPEIKSIAVSQTSLGLATGTSSRLALIATFTDDTTQDVTASATWTSDAPSVASVNTAALSANIGQVSGLAAGSATVTAAYGGSTSTASVTVTTRTIQSLTINPVSGTTVVSGYQLQFRVNANYSDSNIQDVTEDVTWSIDKPNVAILGSNTYYNTGSVQPRSVAGVAAGTATLTATFGGKTQTTTITVQ